MEYSLTDMQVSFYSHGLPQEEILWNLGLSVTFSDAYPTEKLNEALNRLTETYDQIRLQFGTRDNKPYGYILPFRHTQYPVYRFRSADELSDALKEFVNAPIDIHGQLFRYAIFDVCGQTGVMICAHHILLDGYSVQVMVSFLENWLKGQFNPNIPRQTYDESVDALRVYQDSKRYHRDRQYWMSVFAKKPERILFSDSTDFPDYTSSFWEEAISPELFRKIRAYCREQGVSLSSLFCTALAAYINREKGCKKFTIGIPVMNRTTQQELNTIGLYMHILPLVMDLTEGSFRENAMGTEFSKMDLFRHQKMTQSQIQTMLWEENSDTEALFDLIFNYQEFAGDSAKRMRFCYSDALSVPLEIHVQSLSEDLQNVLIRYRTNLFSKEQVCALWERVMHVIEYAIDHPDTCLLQIPQHAISTQEYHDLIVRFNDTAFSYSIQDGATVYSLFEDTAKNHPEKVCITAGGKDITYGQFLKIVRELDGKIRKKLQSKKSVVAILAERSVEMYAAIYAAVRGGNAYLPISPDDPAQRVAYVLDDSGTALVLAQKKHVSKRNNLPCIDLTDFVNSPPEECPDLPPLAQPEDTAYIIYTSGSTGMPKGVGISHQSLLNRILWMHDTYPLSEDGVILQKTPYTFDVSLWEIFWWGICGAKMVASAPGEHFLPARILEAVNHYRVSTMHFVPVVLDTFLTYLKKTGFNYTPECSIRHVFSSGEALSANLVKRFYQLFPYEKVKLHNLYGPTECAVDVTFYDCHPADQDPIPIGKPIYNTQIYVLDSALEPVETGAVGQLCIAGENVGQGYINRPELTTAKFIPNPFGAGKLYLTGDYATINEARQLLFYGRMDHQIKLNGQRIEIGEIETVIRNTEGVQDAAVVICQRNGNKTLAGIYCAKSVQISAIREYCEEKLPSYMVPSCFIQVPEMPINANGKLDKKKLTALAESYAPDQTYAVPITEQEKRIAEIFSEVLRVEKVGRDDHFFSLGGSSLAMIRALSDPFLEGLSASVFIENPTPAKLAVQLNRHKANDTCRIRRLKKGAAGGGVLVLIPYAGGSAEAFAKLVEAAETTCPKCALYCMEYPHSINDCQDAAAELETLSKDNTLFIYSHCAGSAAALQILNILETQGKFLVKQYIAGASIPPDEPPKNNMWNNVPDDMLKSVLEKAGASFDTLSQQHITDMLGRFRQDTDFWTTYFSATPHKISCPVSIILAREDLFTPNDKDAIPLWHRYAQTVTAVDYMDTTSHYFQSEKADDLMKIIVRITDGKN